MDDRYNKYYDDYDLLFKKYSSFLGDYSFKNDQSNTNQKSFDKDSFGKDSFGKDSFLDQSFNLSSDLKTQTTKTTQKTSTKTSKKTSGKVDLWTEEGLLDITKQHGLEEKSKKILPPKGEDPKKIFSGGFISDIFDTLNLLQHGVTGVLKGKSFVEGVKARESFTEKDALGKYGIPGTIAGVALDILVDPLTYVPTLGIGKALLNGLTKTAKAVDKTLRKTPLIKNTYEEAADALGRAFIYRFGQDPVYKELAERNLRNIAINIEKIVELTKPLVKLDPKIQEKIADLRKAGKISLKEIKELKEAPEFAKKLKKVDADDLYDKIQKIYDEVDRLGEEAVKVGLLKKEIFLKRKGEYMPLLYETHEKAPRFKLSEVVNNLDLSRFKARKDIPDEIKELLGEIKTAGYPTLKGLLQVNKAIENAKFFKEVSERMAIKNIDDMVGGLSARSYKDVIAKIPEKMEFGELAGKYLPKPIYDDIMLMAYPKISNKFSNKLVAVFKFSKVVLSPAAHARNNISNMILNDFEGLNPARLDIYLQAARELTKKGKYYQEAKSVGLGLETFASEELKNILLGPEGIEAAKKVGFKLWKQTIGALGEIYQKEEQLSKLAQYIFQRKVKKLSPEEAFKIAEKATFNYSQVTPFIRNLRTSIWGVPFITFTYKATPQITKTIITRPGTISKYGKFKLAIENISDEEELKKERSSEPSWIRDGYYVKLPFKDKHGRSMYFDLTYILPFGDLISGTYLERDISKETGLKEGVPEAAVKKFPFLNTIKELSKNRDFYGDKIFLESDPLELQVADIFRYLARTMLPPPINDFMPGGHKKDGTIREPNWSKVFTLEAEGITDKTKLTRTLFQELFRQVGMKVTPFDIEAFASMLENEREKALRTLLEEEQLIKETYYKPKLKNK